MLFSERSIWTMVHGIGLGGGALIGLAAALFYLYAARSSDGAAAPPGSGALAAATVLSAVLLWLTVIVGTYVIFPPYRVTPPAGVTDLSAFPRALVLASPSTAWLHAFAMESKEHMPWIASMLTTAVAFVTVRYRSTGAPELIVAESFDGAAGDLVRPGGVRVVDGYVRQQGGPAGLGDRR